MRKFVVTAKRNGKLSSRTVTVKCFADAVSESGFLPYQVISVVDAGSLTKRGTLCVKTKPLTFEDTLVDLGEIIERRMRDRRFALLLFEPESPEQGDYISNAQRLDSCIAMSSAQRRLEKISNLEHCVNTTLSAVNAETGEIVQLYPPVTPNKQASKTYVEQCFHSASALEEQLENFFCGDIACKDCDLTSSCTCKGCPNYERHKRQDSKK